MDDELREAVARARAEVEEARAEIAALEAATPVPRLRQESAQAAAQAAALEAECVRAREELAKLKQAEEAAWQALTTAEPSSPGGGG
ncbi:MAG: hypothetical protein AMXMBFR34_46400 [Myxococcaceae bacterium]